MKAVWIQIQIKAFGSGFNKRWITVPDGDTGRNSNVTSRKQPVPSAGLPVAAANYGELDFLIYYEKKQFESYKPLENLF